MPEESKSINDLSINERSYKAHCSDKNDPDFKLLKFNCFTAIEGLHSTLLKNYIII